jgi:hypothetical protein
MALIIAKPGPVKKKKATQSVLESKDEWTGAWMIKADLGGWRSFFAKDITLLLRYKLNGERTRVIKADIQFTDEGYGTTSANFIVEPIIHYAGLYAVFDCYFTLGSGFGSLEIEHESGAKGMDLPLGGRNQTVHCWGGINCADGTGVGHGNVVE